MRCPPAETLDSTVPVVYVAGTCMNAGKTVAATELVRGLARSGLRVAAAKLTGVSLMRDALSMLDAGAVAALTFNDVGIASTHAGVTVATAKGIFNRLAAAKPDVIVAELGDGILGEYGVQDILHDAELMRVGAAYIMAAPDPVACWGAAELMRHEFSLPITAITGPATDNEVGLVYIQTGLGLPAHNARRDAAGLLEVVRASLDGLGESRVRSQESATQARTFPPTRDSRLATVAPMKVAVIGGAGYAAGELLRLLLQHPQVTECVATSRSQAGKPIGEVHPALAPLTDARFSGATPGEAARGRDVVFLCLEHGESSRVAGEVFEAGPGLVVDLAADFRVQDLPSSTSDTTALTRRRSWSAAFATAWPMSSDARCVVRRAIAAPGCFATAAQLALYPLARPGSTSRLRSLR